MEDKRFLLFNSIVMICGGRKRSDQNQAPLFGKSLGEDMVSRSALGQLVMNKHQELLQSGAPLLPTGVPHGLDEALRAIRSNRQAGHMPQRRGYEDQTPMCSNGVGTPHPVLVEAHPHMLRHACGFALADQGADTRLIQDYLGHRNIQHTLRYTGTNPAWFERLCR